MENFFKEHRYLGKLEKSINNGNPLSFIYGKGLNDYSLFDFHLGVKEIEKSLFLYFYNIHKVDTFVVVKDSKITFFDRTGKAVSCNTALAIEKESTGFGNGIDGISGANQQEKAEQQAKDETAGMDNFNTDLKYIEDNFNSKKIAIYFDGFEWSSKLYGSEANLELLKRVRDWDKSKKSFTIVSIKEPDLLKEFGFDIDENLSNMIYLGNPSQQEISKTYRRYINSTHPNINIIEDDFEYIISAIQGSKKSLREAVRVLKRVLTKDIPNKRLTRELFDDAIVKLIDEKVTFDDVIMDSGTKNNIRDLISTFHSDKENSSKGMIMFGPSGTGKTYIAKAIAHEYNMNYIAPSLADLKGEFIGQTSGKVKRIFEEARANSPTVMFLDEIDTIFAKRGSDNSDSYLTDMVNQFLVEIDGATTGKQDIFIIGATNRLETIDSAIRSRLSNEFFIPLPNATNRELMFDRKFKNFKLSQQTWKNEFINRTENMSGRDIENFAKGIQRAINSEDEITQAVFYSALQSLEHSFIKDFQADLDNSIEIDGDVKLKFDDVVGYENIKTILKSELNYILSTPEQKQQMKDFQIIPKRGNLLYGPPGNGKTTFAKALAGENGFYYIKILSKDFSGYGSIEILKKLELIFENTIKLSKITSKKGVVLFFDEVDTLISSNMDSTVRGTLLNFLEDSKGIKSEDSKVILISATNFKENLDEASIREGRFDSKLEIGYPTPDEAINMIKNFFETDETLNISNTEDSFYTDLYNDLELSKIAEINRENLRIRDERFHKNFEGISTVDLKAVKEKVKRENFDKGLLDNNKIMIN